MGMQAHRQVQLPDSCGKWGADTPKECIDKCYAKQVDREKAAADREMAWGIAGSVVGGASGVLDAMPSKKSKADGADLIQVARYGSNATVKSKFLGVALAAVGMAVEIGGAVHARQDAYAEAKSDNCEQLSSQLLTSQIDAQTEELRLAMEEQTEEQTKELKRAMQEQTKDLTEHMDKKVAEVLESVDLVRQDVAAVKGILGNLEVSMTAKLSNLQARTDEVLAVVKNIELQQMQNDLTTKLTEFMRCAGNVAHVFGMVQSGLSDKVTYDWGLKRVLENSNSSDSSRLSEEVVEWKRRYSDWNANFLQLMDQSALHALEGMRCMSVLVSSGNLLNLYYEGRMRDEVETAVRHEISAGAVYADAILSKIYSMSLDAGKAVFEDDDVLLTSLNAMSELRYVLAAIPRESYWEDFKVYAANLKLAFSTALDDSVNNAWIMKIMKDAIKEIFPATFSFKHAVPDDQYRVNALEQAGGQWSQYSTSTSSGHKIVLMVRDVQDIIQIDLEGEVTTTTPTSMYLFDWIESGSCNPCFWNYALLSPSDVDDLASSKKQHVPQITGDAAFGFSGLGFADSFTVSQRIENLGHMRRTNQAAWTCRVRDLVNKAEAIASVSDCVVNGIAGSSAALPAIATGFEDGMGPWTASATGLPFSRNSGGTTSTGTGPSGAVQGSYYVYTEASSPNFPSKDFYLSTSFDATGFLWAVSFNYHMTGTSVGSLELEVQDATGQWTRLWHLEGDQGSDWLEAKATIPVDAVSIRFHAVSGDSWSSDIAIDDIKTSKQESVSMERCLDEGRIRCPSSAVLSCRAWFPQCAGYR